MTLSEICIICIDLCLWCYMCYGFVMLPVLLCIVYFFFFFFSDAATTEIYTLYLVGSVRFL